MQLVQLKNKIKQLFKSENYCKICFKKINQISLHNIFSNNIICRKCLKSMDPKFYSFKEQKSIELEIAISTEDIPAYSSTYFTYDENAFYYYDINSDTKRIVRISRDDWSEETIAEGDILDSEAGWRINQVDEEYFYHGDQMYPIS